VADRPDLYLRYSNGPATDKGTPSYDYEAGVSMPGLSVTPLGPPRWWARPPIDWVARRVCKYLELGEDCPDRRPWVMAGRVTDTGPDHEPLVVDVEPIAWVGPHAVAQARQHYEDRFAAGRDSRG